MTLDATTGAAPAYAGVPVGALDPLGRGTLGWGGAPSNQDDVAARLRAVIATLDALNAQYASWDWPIAGDPRDDVQVEPLPDFRGNIPGTNIPDVGRPEDATAIPHYHERTDVDSAIWRQPPDPSNRMVSGFRAPLPMAVRVR